MIGRAPAAKRRSLKFSGRAKIPVTILRIGWSPFRGRYVVLDGAFDGGPATLRVGDWLDIGYKFDSATADLESD